MIHLTEHDCELFLRAGGVLDLETFAGLDAPEREAFARAGDRVRSDLARAIAAAQEAPVSFLDESRKAQGKLSFRASRQLREAVHRVAKEARHGAR